jgi:excisionase family DNA binding protein
MKEILTVKQMAQYLQMNEHTIYRLARSGEIPSVKISGQWRFKKDLIDRWIIKASMQRVRSNKKTEKGNVDQMQLF